jgi:hypothetical protein
MMSNKNKGLYFDQKMHIVFVTKATRTNIFIRDPYFFNDLIDDLFSDLEL